MHFSLSITNAAPGNFPGALPPAPRMCGLRGGVSWEDASLICPHLALILSTMEVVPTTI